MTKLDTPSGNATQTTKYLNPLAVWALAFGCMVGWGAFVMPGTTFLPDAGPLGSVLGLFIGGLVMTLIGVNYYPLMQRYPGPGGSYLYARNVLGADHGFLCAWMLIITFASVIWANATALSLICRYLFGNIFCFGLMYKFADYNVYFGEVLLSAAILLAACLLCAIKKKVAIWAQTILGVMLLLGICACFIAVVVHNGGIPDLSPLFSGGGSPLLAVLSLVALAPWAYVGFESISHSTGEFRFKSKKILPVIIASIFTASAAYIMLSLCAAMAYPDGYSSWGEYIAALPNLKGIAALPTFNSARQAMGTPGLVLLGVTAFCGVATGVIGNYVALSRLTNSMARDKMLPAPFKKLNRDGVPWVSVCLITAVSLIIPLLGRTAIGWIVDVTTVGSVVIYAYISVCVLTLGIREKRKLFIFTGALGTLITIAFTAAYLIPNLSLQRKLSSESFLILIVWSLLGMVLLHRIIRRDGERRYGKSNIVLVILLVLVLVISLSWINRVTLDHADAAIAELRDSYNRGGMSLAVVSDEIERLADSAMRNILLMDGLIVCAIAVVFAIFSIIKRREKQIEAERILAEEKNRAKTIFLSNMSHDIRTPMNAVTGYTRLALMEDDLPEKTREYLNKIDSSGAYLLSLINDILDMSRIESGRVELENAPADLFSIADEVMSIFSLQMQSKQLSFTCDRSEISDRYVICDRKRITRILMNLVSNAYKFTNSGGAITIVLRQLGVTDDGKGRYEMSVADTGIGMSEEFAHRVFDAFERECNHTVNKQEGTGLGMTIAKSFVDLMGGTISIDTKQGMGTKVSVRLELPLTTAEQTAELAGDADASDRSFKGRRLLLAEDNPINSEIARSLLEGQGFEVDTAENGQEAVDAVASAPEDTYDVILMDVQMPVMNGYEATRLIRAMKGSRGSIPVIAVTANTFDTDRDDAKNAGMNAHVSKPLEPTVLFATLAKFCNR